ncbi:MAG: hypothetical protein MJ007_04840 [Paludibacteraceae bacterium]|nr:hypothetical protein [Paludibacteraceae bacterium]
MLKANRVGVHPSQVDQLGYLVGGGGSTDAYTKTESDAKYVNKDQLKANNKNFYFAYDSTTQKYGYKTSKTGDFIPFSSGADTGIVVNAPSTEKLVPLGGNCEIVEGGYELLSSKSNLINMTVRVLKDLDTSDNIIENRLPGTTLILKDCDVTLTSSFLRPNRNVTTGTLLHILGVNNDN